MHIGLLQCGHFATADGYPKRTYTDFYSKMLEGHGFTMTTYSVVDMEFPEGPEAAEGWLLSGSRHGAYEDLPFIAPLEDLVRQIYAANVPMFGICFGHQIMAQALGGKVEKFDGGWSIGRVEYDFGDETLAINAWHQDQVTKLPADAKTIAATDFCAHAGIAYKGRAMSVQPHPEFDPMAMELLLKERAPGLVPPNIVEQAEAVKSLPTDNDKMAKRIAEFFKEAQNG